MKKVIALALAMAMALSMTSMALDFELETAGDNPAASSEEMLPGEDYHFEVGMDLGSLREEDGDVIEHYSDAFRITTDWDKGSALVSSVKFDNDCDHIVISLKENYTIEDAKDLVGTITLVAKDDIYQVRPNGRLRLLYEDNAKLNADFEGTVCNMVEDIDGGDNRDDATPVDVADNTIYNVTTSGWFDFGGDGERLSSVLVRLPEDKQVFAYWNEDPIEDVEDKYYDLDAEIEYVNFVAKPNLGRNAEIAIQGDYSDQYYLYEVVNGDLEPIDADWNEDDGLFEFTASKLTSYVISDKELVAEADEPADDTADEPATDDTTTQNPDTGANDVVGVAVALAAVSLVAAGAVSLKK